MQPTAEAVGGSKMTKEPRRGERKHRARCRNPHHPARPCRRGQPGDSLTGLLLGALKHHKLRPGDILVIKHKIVSKAEGQLVDLKTIKPSAASRRWAQRYHLDARVIELAILQSRRIVRRKRGVLITETHHGLICANSAVDVSNVDGGRHALLLARRSRPIRRANPSRAEKNSAPFPPSDHHRYFRPALARRLDRSCHRSGRHAGPSRLSRAA